MKEIFMRSLTRILRRPSRYALVFRQRRNRSNAHRATRTDTSLRQFQPAADLLPNPAAASRFCCRILRTSKHRRRAKSPPAQLYVGSVDGAGVRARVRGREAFGLTFLLLIRGLFALLSGKESEIHCEVHKGIYGHGNLA